MFLFGRRLSGNIEYIIAGLGNPGEKYAFTRHNAGFLAVDYLSRQANIKVDRLKFKSVCGTGEIAGKKVLIIKPQTFMNNSGEAVREAAAFYKVPMEKVIVIYDDVSLPLGALRIRKKGSDGGHNGIKSIIYQTGTDIFPRVKLGIGAKPENWDLVDWVLGKFTDDERKAMFEAFKRCAAAVEMIVAGDIDGAMNKFN